VTDEGLDEQEALMQEVLQQVSCIVVEHPSMLRCLGLRAASCSCRLLI
jgi:hypothetical protein